MREWLLPGEGAITVPVARYQSICKTRDAWPENWPGRWREPGRLARADIFDVADRWREQQAPARHLLGATLAWGFGNTGYGGKRTEWILAPHDLDERLEAGLTPLTNEDPNEQDSVEAYQAFNV